MYRFRCADGSYRWTEALSTVGDRGRTSVLVVSTSATSATARSPTSTCNARRRPIRLTGIANRTVFMDRLHQALRRLERHDGLVAVLFLDLDRFKLINDTVGHHVGDAVLLQMAERLRGFLRPQDTLARLGGDEFAIVVEDMTWAEEAVALGTRIIEAGRAPFLLGDEQFICTTSVGISVTPDPHHSAEGLLQEADLALYRAKDRGRDRAEVFDEDLRTRAVGRLGTERMLRRAIDEDRLRVEYQPIIDLRTGDTVAAEALVRVWDPDAVASSSPPRRSSRSPRRPGCCATIDDWVLGAGDRPGRAVARTGSRVPASADIAINVTARHLADPGFAPIGRSTTSPPTTCPPESLQIEVTERVLMEASNSAMTGLKSLRDAGVKVGLDDFGTGYSSLSYLRMFPLDFVKIDRSFIAELGPVGTPNAPSSPRSSTCPTPSAWPSSPKGWRRRPSSSSWPHSAATGPRASGSDRPDRHTASTMCARPSDQPVGDARGRRHAVDVDRWCREQLGSGVAVVRWFREGTGLVWGVDLDDGRPVVVKAHRRGHVPDEHLVAFVEVQRRVAGVHPWAPMPLAGPAPLGDRVATAEALLADGVPASDAATMAGALRALVAAAGTPPPRPVRAVVVPGRCGRRRIKSTSTCTPPAASGSTTIAAAARARMQAPVRHAVRRRPRRLALRARARRSRHATRCAPCTTGTRSPPARRRGSPAQPRSASPSTSTPATARRPDGRHPPSRLPSSPPTTPRAARRTHRSAPPATTTSPTSPAASTASAASPRWPTSSTSGRPAAGGSTVRP